jgi:hypothetical protein
MDPSQVQSGHFEPAGNAAGESPKEGVGGSSPSEAANRRLAGRGEREVHPAERSEGNKRSAVGSPSQAANVSSRRLGLRGRRTLITARLSRNPAFQPRQRGLDAAAGIRSNVRDERMTLKPSAAMGYVVSNGELDPEAVR